jgi:hypothetical protein
MLNHMAADESRPAGNQYFHDANSGATAVANVSLIYPLS